MVGGASPLLALADRLPSICAEFGVPVWLMLAQARQETSMGWQKNGTCAEGRAILHADGSASRTGSAHNLFNITGSGTS